jgi:prepilin-type N-terminal cleavage/methylation domain-containing protein
MQARKGFTLIELMVVILIVSILAAVSIPIMRGRIDAAKWSEGRAMMGTIATALRAYGAEKGPEPDGDWPPTLTQLGFQTGDLEGTYFTLTSASWASAAYPSGGDLTYTITVAAPTGINTPSNITLDEDGEWVETP